MSKSKRKICFICSSGGHFSELSKLKTVAEGYDSFLVVEKTEGFKTDFCKKQYFLSVINRKEFFFILHFLWMLVLELLIFFRERPDYIITTGALCSYPMARIAHFFRKKVIYIESYARIYDLSNTGHRMYRFADCFIVQWPELLEKYPKAEYHGDLFGENE